MPQKGVIIPARRLFKWGDYLLVGNYKGVVRFGDVYHANQKFDHSDMSVRELKGIREKIKLYMTITTEKTAVKPVCQ